MIVNPISYAGNKTKLINEIVPELDKTCSVFVDVFSGSGMVAVNSGYTNLVCNDISKEAIDMIGYFYNNTSEKIITDAEKNIAKYNLTYSRIKPKGTYKEEKHEGLSKYNKDGFTKLKNDYNNKPSLDKLFLLLIYGFNHYMRFNAKGEYNVPVGKVDLSSSIYKNTINFSDGIKTRNIEFSIKDFRDMSLYEKTNAFYYFDPPYLITTAPYNSNWSEEDEKDLLRILDGLNERNIKFALSNVLLSNGKENKILKEWSKKYKVIKMRRQYRNANYQKKNITDSEEVLIKNY